LWKFAAILPAVSGIIAAEISGSFSTNDRNDDVVVIV